MEYKIFRSIFALMLVVGLAAIQSSPSVQAAKSMDVVATIYNGNFETGDLSGWSLFTTSNGVAFTYVVPFDTNGDGVSSYSARFGVGQLVYQGDDFPEGGGIYQGVHLVKGDLNITADIASNFPYNFCNFSGGEFQLIVDGVVVDTHDFDLICNNETKRSTLNANVSIDTVGAHEIRFVVLRPAGLSGVVNYLDNVVISGSATLNRIDLDLDIMPGSETNPINLNSKGLIPVAIFSRPDFDAPSLVDQSSLRFGYHGVEKSLAFCNTGGEDVNDDGLPDLVCHFETDLSRFSTNSQRGVLRGYSINGTYMYGFDTVNVLK